MSKIRKPWTTKENTLYKKLYQTNTVKEMCKYFPNRSHTSLQVRASALGMKRSIKLDKKNRLEVLLNKCPETYYWLGVLFADGHFYEKRIALTMSEKDIDQAKKYALYTGVPLYIRKTLIPNKMMCSLYGWDSRVVPLLRAQFKIHSHKTYFPCRINHILDKDLLFSLIIGLIDGDGCILSLPDDSCKISIGMHKNWYNVLLFISKFLTKISKIVTPPPRVIKGVQATINEPMPRIIKASEYATLVIANNTLCKFIKCKALKLQLPIMTRKWDKINLLRINKRDVIDEKLRTDLLLIKKMRKQGKTLTQIAQTTGRGHAGVDLIIQKYKIKNVNPRYFKHNKNK